jgi:Tol biopolymer transport system component
MIHWQRKILRWLLAGGAFLSVLNLSGCTTDDKPAAGSASAPSLAGVAPAGSANIAMAADSSVLAPVSANDAATTAAPNVNVFGEFDGVQHGPAKPHGNGGFEEQTYLDEGFDSDVSLDPTGKWMVFTSTRDSDHPNIYLQRVDGVSVIQLTNDEAEYASPVFSPDGKQIAFCSTRAGEWDIYTMDADGKNVVQVTNDPMQHIHPSFSPDGTRLVYCCLGGKSGQWELWTVDLTTSEKRMIGFGLFPTWCPAKNVDRIAFQRARQRGSRWFSLWTLDLTDGESRRVTEVAASSNAAIVCPTWSPDGKQIAFATIAEPNNSTGAKPLGQQDIWTVTSDGSGRHRVTDGVGLNLSPCWAANNRIFFVSDRGGAECIWSAQADATGEPSRVASQPPGNLQEKSAEKPTGQDAVGSTAGD